MQMTVSVPNWKILAAVVLGVGVTVTVAAIQAQQKSAKGAALIEGRPLFENSESGASPAAYGSITLAGKYLFLISNKGEAVVLEATRSAPLVHRNRLPGGSGSSPVFSSCHSSN